jgi:hypothetical protein
MEAPSSLDRLNEQSTDAIVSDVAELVSEKKNRKSAKKHWISESYLEQTRNIWPGRGRHVLAQVEEVF